MLKVITYQSILCTTCINVRGLGVCINLKTNKQLREINHILETRNQGKGTKPVTAALYLKDGAPK